MRALRALFLLCLPVLAFAQAAPADPGSPEEAAEKLRAMIREVMSASPGKVIRDGMGDYQTALRARYAKSLVPLPDEPQPLARPFKRDADDSLRYLNVPRFRKESVDLGLLRPTGRLLFGVGRSESRVVQRDRSSTPAVDKYIFLKIQLSKPGGDQKRGLLFPPAVEMTETEVSPRNRVSVEEHDRGFKELREILP